MKIEKVNATIRYSQDTGHGAWKLVELGAEASICDREFWQQAHSTVPIGTCLVTSKMLRRQA